MSYDELLEQPEWQVKCSKIIQRDQYRCQKCGRIGFCNMPVFAKAEDMSVIYELTKKYRYLSNVFNLTFKELCDAGFIDDFFSLKEDKQKDNNKGWYLTSCHSLPHKVKSANKYFIYDLAQIFYDNEPLSKELVQYSAIYKPQGKDIVLYTERELQYIKFRLLRLETYSRKGNGVLPLYIFKFEQKLSDKYLISIVRTLSQQKNLIVSMMHNNFLFYFYLDANDIEVPGLCIHHKYYMDGLKPWEYEDDDMETICADCNRELHQHGDTIKYAYKDKSKIIGYPPVCPICHGSGYNTDFWFYKNGVCMSCGGEGVMVNGFNDY